MCEALVFSIEEFATFDGPGIRTTVFLKGCPLRCSWCHNPEGQRFENEILKAPNGCVGCGACLAAGNGTLCDDSLRACPNRLLRWSGERYTPESLVRKLADTFEILKLSGGGVTFSGGEPLAHPAFLTETLRLLEGKIHTAVQTSGYGPEDLFKQVLALTDYMLFDIKLADSHAHRRYTGVDNQVILRNFGTLVNSGKPFTVRTPLIPGVTDTSENLTAVAELLRSYGVSRIELLPYNRAAGGKYAAVGRTYAPDFDENIPCHTDTAPFEARGIQAIIL